MTTEIKHSHFLQDESHKHFPPHQQWRYSFDNGWEASVISGWPAYGGGSGHFEIMVWHDELLPFSEADPVGWLTIQQVGRKLDGIERRRGT